MPVPLPGCMLEIPPEPVTTNNTGMAVPGKTRQDVTAGRQHDRTQVGDDRPEKVTQFVGDDRHETILQQAVTEVGAVLQWTFIVSSPEHTERERGSARNYPRAGVRDPTDSGFPGWPGFDRPRW